MLCRSYFSELGFTHSHCEVHILSKSSQCCQLVIESHLMFFACNLLNERAINLILIYSQVLMYLGADALRETIENAELYPIRGLFNFRDFFDEIDAYYHRTLGYEYGISTGWRNLDDLYNVMTIYCIYVLLNVISGSYCVLKMTCLLFIG